MGDPSKIRRKYETPSHPWQKDRIEEEKKIRYEYGLKNKKDIWKMSSALTSFKDEAKRLSSRFDEQSKLEQSQLVDRLANLGLMQKGDPMDKILGLELKDIAERRLQTLLVRKGLARTMKQSRQFITHGHVLVDKKKITFPNYQVPVKEEGLIEFLPKSSLARDDHPERIVKEAPKKVEKKKKEVKEDVPPTFEAEELKKIEEEGIAEKVAPE